MSRPEDRFWRVSIVVITLVVIVVVVAWFSALLDLAQFVTGDRWFG